MAKRLLWGCLFLGISTHAFAEDGRVGVLYSKFTTLLFSEDIVDAELGSGDYHTKVKGKYLQSIDETRVSDPNWAQTHMQSIALNYKRAPHFEEVSPWLFAEMKEVAN